MDAPARYDVFVSYAEADRAWVEGYLLDALTAAGVRVYSEAAFALGAPLLGEFERAVGHSERTLLVLSPAYLTDDFSRFGDLLAQTYGLETSTWPVIPLILQPVTLPPRLAILTPLEATDPSLWPDALARLGEALRHPVPRDRDAETRPPCPYPGMVPFGENDRARFFGRDADVDALLHALHIHPLACVIGPSGSGKSSLVFAGLIPALKHSTLFGEGTWQVFTMRPGARPLDALEAALGLRRRSAKAQDLDGFIAHASRKRRLLVVDQFEEIFTVSEPAQALAFQTSLRALLDIPQFHVVLTVRADFYAELMNAPMWPVITGHRVEVLPLNEAGLREAILRPAEGAGVYVEAALVERLAADATGEPGMLPLLQETLVLLWEHLERRYLPLRAYQMLVMSRRSYQGIGTEPSGLQVAMARRADTTYACVSPEQQAIARRIFLRLVHFGEGRSDTRRQQRVDALRDPADDPSLFDATLSHFAEERLLTLSGDERGGRRVDLAHEALIGGWPMLQEWLAERRDAEIIRRRLEAKAAEWERLGRGSGGLLDDTELPEAERWLADPIAADLGAGEDVPALIEASRAAIEARRREAEAARKRELEQAQALAAAERGRAQDQAVAATRLRRWLLAASVAALLAVGAASGALYAFNRANDERDRAQAAEAGLQDQVDLARVRALAGQASAQLQLHNDELASLLALQAWTFHQETDGEAWDQVDAALRQTMAAPFFSRVLPQGAAVESLAFDAEGTRVATGDREGRVRVWDPQESATVSRMASGPGGWVTALAFSPDGSLLAVGTRDGALSIYGSSLDGPPMMDLTGAPGRISSLAFIGKDLLAIVAAKPDVYRWNLDAPGEAQVIVLPDGNVAKAMIVDEAARPLVAGVGDDGLLHLWELAQPERTMPLLLGQEDWTPDLAVFRADGHALVAVGTDESMRVWDLREPASRPMEIPPVSPTTSITAIAMDRSGARIGAMTGDGALVLWHLGSRMEPQVMFGHADIGIAAAFSPDGSLVVTGGGDAARLWSLAAPAEPMVLSGHARPVRSVAYSPDGALLASAGDDGKVRLWDAATGEPHGEPLTGHAGTIYSVTFSPDSKTLASAGVDGVVRLWAVDDPAAGPRVLAGQGQINAVAYSPDGKLLAAASMGNVIVWDVARGEKMDSIAFPGPYALSLAFDPSGRMLAAGGCLQLGAGVGVCETGGVALWSLDAPAAPVVTLEHARDAVYSVAFDAGGQWVAAAAKDGPVRRWRVDDPATSELVLDGAGSASLAFSPAGVLAVGHWNGTITLVRLDAPGRPSLLSSHHGFVYAVAYAPNGQMFAAAGSDGTVQLWHTTESLASAVCDRVGRNLSGQEWSRFVGESIPYEATCPGLPSGVDVTPVPSLSAAGRE